MWLFFFQINNSVFVSQEDDELAFSFTCYVYGAGSLLAFHGDEQLNSSCFLGTNEQSFLEMSWKLQDL